MFVSFNLRSLDGVKQSRGGLARWFPARRVAGRRGKVGEKYEELESYLLGGRGSSGEGRRRRVRREGRLVVALGHCGGALATMG